MKRTLFGLVLCTVFAFGAGSVFAAEFKAPDRKSGGNLTLSTTKTYRNLYTVGGTVMVNSAIQGDILLAGGTVTIDGAVEQDVTVAGGTVTINNKVGGDIRAVGGTLIINATVNGDVVVIGGSLVLSERAMVSGDLIVAGGSVTIDAPVNGYVKIFAGDVSVNSNIKGDVAIRGGNRVEFGEKAVVTSKLLISGPSEPIIASSAEVPNLEFTHTEQKNAERGMRALITTGILVKLFAMFIAGLLFMYFWPRKSGALINATRQGFWSNAGVGLVTVIVTPVAAVLLFFTLVGSYIALIILTAFVLLLFISCIVATVFLGNWILGKLMKGKEQHEPWQVVLVGVAAFTLLGFIPILGWLVQAVLGLAAIGSITRFMTKVMREEKIVS